MPVRDIARSSYDVIVVGARCAGAATAMLLARQGLDVLVLERGQHGTDTLSTHALMRGGVLQLARWGVLGTIVAAGTPPIHTTSFHYGDAVTRVPIKARDGVDALYAPRRTVLDAALARAATESGATIVYGVVVRDVVRDRLGRVAGVSLRESDGAITSPRARIVVGADGLRSTIAAAVEAPSLVTGRHASGVLYAYWDGIDASENQWHYRVGASAGLIPTNDAQTCVFASMPGARFRDEMRLDIDAGYRRIITEAAPGLGALLARARKASPIRGFSPEPGFMRQAWGPGWALVGDAGYFRDPLTAHGMTDAFRDAELLARAIAMDSDAALADYQAARDAAARGIFEASDDIASFEWDLETLQARHRFMSEEMNREVAMLLGLGPAPAREAVTSADYSLAGGERCT